MSRLINDQFAGLDISRQRRYQMRRKAEGKCIQCGAKALPDMTCCEPCHQLRYRRVQKYQGKPENPRTDTKFARALREI